MITEKLVFDAQNKGFRMNNLHNRVACPNCMPKALEMFPSGEFPEFVNPYAGVFTHRKDSRNVIHACSCGYRHRVHMETADEARARMTKEKAVKAAKNRPLCKQCGKSPIPEGRKAKCYNCCPPAKKAATQPKEPIQEAASKQGMALY